MYALYPLGSIVHDPSALWLSYDWESFDNHEWRPCVEHFLNEVAALDHKVISVESPAFTLGEDFVEITYLLDGSRTTLSSDHLLSLITLASDDPRVLRSVWEPIGNKVGWVNL